MAITGAETCINSVRRDLCETPLTGHNAPYNLGIPNGIALHHRKGDRCPLGSADLDTIDDVDRSRGRTPAVGHVQRALQTWRLRGCPGGGHMCGMLNPPRPGGQRSYSKRGETLAGSIAPVTNLKAVNPQPPPPGNTLRRRMAPVVASTAPFTEQLRRRPPAFVRQLQGGSYVAGLTLRALPPAARSTSPTSRTRHAGARFTQLEGTSTPAPVHACYNFAKRNRRRHVRSETAAGPLVGTSRTC